MSKDIGEEEMQQKSEIFEHYVSPEVQHNVSRS